MQGTFTQSTASGQRPISGSSLFHVLKLLPSILLVSFPLIAAAESVNYMSEVKPLLATACVQCHGAANPKGGLRLDTAAAMLKGGGEGPSVAPGKPDQSLLLTLLRGAHDEIPQMPYKRNPLAPEQVTIIEQWIQE